MSNPLLSFDGLPRFAEIAPPQVAEAVDSALADAQKSIDGIAADGQPPTWENTMAPLEAACEKISRVWNQVEHMHSVMSSPEWRAAYNDNLQKITAFYTLLGQHEGVYKRLQALAETDGFSALPAARQKIVSDSCRDFRLSGVGLSGGKKKQFRENSEQLAARAAKFEENLLEATKDFSLVAAKEDIGDMPADLAAIAAADAKAHGGEGYRFTLQPPSYLAFMQYAVNRAQREEMHRAYVTRASEFGPAARDNSPLVDEILQKRQQQAALLGFGCYADMALETRMASSTAAVMEFLRDMAARAKPHAEREMAALKKFAADELGIEALEAWDVSYAAEQLRRARFDFSDADLRPYLREDKILQGLFGCLERLFGVSLRPAADASLWQEDVRFMELCGGDGGVIGGVYLDLYAREDKRGGAWMADALSRFRRGGALQLPLAHVTCNFSKPVGGQALLNWDEVVTLFHEFGHAVHHLLTEIDDYSAAGISGVEWDAVELPSQWLENFVWEWEVLEGMTAHCDSGAPMPRALFDKLQAARRFHSGLWLMRQLEFSLFDMALHDGTSLADKGVNDLLQEVRRHTAVLQAPEYSRFYCGFSHVFAGGYAAGYYSYLWAEVLAADVFMLFKESRSVLDRDLGERFRREVLAVGGSRPAMESFVAVRGRPPDINPLLVHYGLGAAA